MTSEIEKESLVGKNDISPSTRSRDIGSDEGHITTREEAIQESRKLLELAIPTICIQLSTVVPPFLIASFVGRQYGSIYLDAFSLANLTGNLFTLSLLQGLFSATDTLSPQAFGAQNEREVGLIAIRGMISSMTVLIPINIVLMLSMGQIMEALGIDHEVAYYAWKWYQIYCLSLPFWALFQAAWKFLSAQSIMAPCLGSVAVSTFVVLPLAMSILPRVTGFWGTAWAFVSFQLFEGVSLVAYSWWKQPHGANTWPGLDCWREALNRERMSTYLALAAGGILASSEWIFWESLSLMTGVIGVDALSIHTIFTNMVVILFMIAFGLGIALAIRLGTVLPQSVTRAKQLVRGCCIASTFVFGSLIGLMHVNRLHLYRLFTNEEEIINGAEEVWPSVCMYAAVLCGFALTTGLATGLGMQWTLGVVTFFGLWVVALPAAYYLAIVHDGGLKAAWMCIWPAYLFIDVVLMVTICFKDWNQIADKIRRREGLETPSKHGSQYGSTP